MKLALLALATSSSMAVHVTFRRFSEPDCPETNHIAKDTDLHNPHCKTFDHHEPPFESFLAIPNDDEEDMVNKLCQAVIYAEPGCKGAAFTFDGQYSSFISHSMLLYMVLTSSTDLETSQDVCGNPINVQGRSVKISCQPRPQTVLTSTLTPSPTHIVIADRPTATVTVTTAATHSLKTVTLVPQSTSFCDCD